MSDANNDLNREAQAIWNQKADFWNELMAGDGNMFHRLLVRPAAERLLNVQKGELVLDVACGNGLFARQLAELGAQVVASDFSERFIELARANTSPANAAIDYRVVDATNREQLLALGEKRFDAAVCNMALMDIADIEPLLTTLPRLLKDAGRFVFTVPHPCFNSGYTRFLMEEEDRVGTLVLTTYVKMADYLQPSSEKGIGAPGEPLPHYYFHRPLHLLLNSCFKAGFVMDGIEEPAFGDDVKSNRPLSWASFKTIPPIMGVRLRQRPL